MAVKFLALINLAAALMTITNPPLILLRDRRRRWSRRYEGAFSCLSSLLFSKGLGGCLCCFLLSHLLRKAAGITITTVAATIASAHHREVAACDSCGIWTLVWAVWRICAHDQECRDQRPHHAGTTPVVLWFICRSLTAGAARVY